MWGLLGASEAKVPPVQAWWSDFIPRVDVKVEKGNTKSSSDLHMCVCVPWHAVSVSPCFCTYLLHTHTEHMSYTLKKNTHVTIMPDRRNSLLG